MTHYAVNGHLPFVKSPLLGPHAHDEEIAYLGALNPLEHHEPKTNESSENAVELVGDDHTLHHMPQFLHHKKSSNLELFYDLFFVANLTVFTTVKEVTSRDTLSQYIGFFVIMWFTWYQVGLYDVRFSTDSVIERVAKACQFGVMIGLAICGPEYDVGQTEDDQQNPIDYTYFRALSLILMASRLVLVFQYLQALFFVHKAPNAKKVEGFIGGMAATYFIAAMIYLGLTFTFNTKDGEVNHTYVGWYVVGIVETAVVTFISRGSVGFKGTHLGERMSLLTLIILGEGVMGVAEKCQHIARTMIFPFNASVIGTIICAVLILYFLYMLYFDWTDEENEMNTIRSQLWGFSHFPLHISLVLAVQGVSQLVLWDAAVQQSNTVNNVFNKYNQNFTTTAEWTNAADMVSSLTYNITWGTLSTTDSLADTFEALNLYGAIANATQDIMNGTQDQDSAYNAYYWLWNTAYNEAFYAAGFGGELNLTKQIEDYNNGLYISFAGNGSSSQAETDDATTRIAGVFEVTYIYFFVSIGLYVILNTWMAAVSNKTKTGYHWVRLGFMGCIGLGLCLLSVMATGNEVTASNSLFNNYTNFAYSSTMLPVATISLFLVVVLNSVRLRAPGREQLRRLSRPIISRKSSGRPSS